MSRLAIILTTFNRPDYLAKTLESIRRLDPLPEETIFLISDDCSDDPVTKTLIKQFPRSDTKNFLYVSPVRGGIKNSLMLACERAFNHGAQVVMNFDPDCELRNDAVTRLMELREAYKGNLITGFHSDTKNDDGSPRHEIIEEYPDCYVKKTVGGINFVFDQSLYKRYIRPALVSPGNWDQNACLKSYADGLPVICPKESLVEHIGDWSAMGHHNYGPPDKASGFKNLHLPDVTLIGVSTNEYEELQAAASISTEHIKFGEVKLLRPEGVNSKATYNQFVMNELVNHVNTDYFIIFQPDGYILDWRAFDKRFYEFDYIGAPWLFSHKEYPGCHVGNGGASWRSKKLHKIIQEDPAVVPANDPYIRNYEEDHNICKIYRTYLERKHGIKYAPISVAEKFSIEAYGGSVEDKMYKGSFMFHGWNVIFNGPARPWHIPRRPAEKPKPNASRRNRVRK